MIFTKSNINNNIHSNKTAFGFVLLILPVLLYFNLSTPLWGNILLAFGAFNQAEYHWAFPDSIFYADYLRGGFYKFIMYFIYKLVGLFVDMDHHFVFQLLSKIIYYSGCMTFTYLSLKLGKPQQSTKERLILSGFIWCVVLLGGYRQFMESEELAAILVLGHTMLMISPHKWANRFSGIFLFMLFGCKAVTILYAGFAPLYWLFFAYEKDKLPVLIKSHLIFLTITGILYFTIFLPELNNIRTAMAYQDSAKINTISSIVKFSLAFIRYSYYQPTLLIIPLATVLTLFVNRKLFFFFIINILLAAASVILQNRFSSPYHFLSFLPLIIFVYYIAAEKYRIILPLLFLLPFYVTIKQNISVNISYPKASNLLYKSYFDNQVVNSKFLNVTINNTSGKNNDTMLFLTGDCPPYFFSRPNSNNTVGALLLNRGIGREQLKISPDYISLVQNINNYNGQFILLDPEYLPLEKLPFIQEKLKSSYHPVVQVNNIFPELGEGTYHLYQRN